MDKFLDKKSLDKLIKGFKNKKLQFAYTSGVFDILHAGHVNYLNKAKNDFKMPVIIGLNSDKSVKANKGSSRPINSFKNRLEVLCSLSSVDYVFELTALNNNKIIETFKPDIYFKAGDYDSSKLSSATIVSAYGGKTVIIPIQNFLSTTQIIQKIELNLVNQICKGSFAQPPKEKQKVVFLDRDGTLIKLVDYLHQVEKIEYFENSFSALKDLISKGYRLVIITNQPGIGLGYFEKEDFYKVTLELFKKFSSYEVFFDKVYFSTETINDNSKFRKPNIGFIQKAVKELNIDLEQSFFVGDSLADLECAKNAGIKSILVKTGKYKKELECLADYIIRDISLINSVI